MAAKKKSSSRYHTTKDGRRVKKGLWDNINKSQTPGTIRPGKGTVTDKASRRSRNTTNTKVTSKKR